MGPNPTTRPTITLYRGWKAPGAYVWSPFVTKLEARLRFGGLSYRAEAGSPREAPRGKIPYISLTTENDGAGQDPATQSKIGDSTLIIEKLIADGILHDLNSNLSATEKAHDLAIRALLEDKLYFYQNYERWHENYYTMRSQVLSALPYPIQVVVGLLAYRSQRQTLYGQGTGRLSVDEIDSFKLEVWENVNALLTASKDKLAKRGVKGAMFWVLGGSGPSEADAVLFGFIASALACTACVSLAVAVA
ncbi:MAG: hypothetical protein Q9191_002772 [Dirinaria sp. TL-2023a]